MISLLLWTGLLTWLVSPAILSLLIAGLIEGNGRLDKSYRVNVDCKRNKFEK